MMGQKEIHEYLTTRFPDITVAENFGYTFFLYADEVFTPFATIAQSDNEQDRVSALNRDGVFRLNIGIGKDRFRSLCGDTTSADYTRLNVIMPHPHYAAQHFICVLNPEGDTLEVILECLDEAYQLAKSRYDKRHIAKS